jgi:hypothetical protein
MTASSLQWHVSRRVLCGAISAEYDFGLSGAQSQDLSVSCSNTLFTSSLDAHEWSALRSDRFIPLERALVILFTGFGARCFPELVLTWKRRGEDSCPYMESNHGRPSRSLVTILSWVSQLIGYCYITVLSHVLPIVWRDWSHQPATKPLWGFFWYCNFERLCLQREEEKYNMWTITNLLWKLTCFLVRRKLALKKFHSWTLAGILNMFLYSLMLLVLSNASKSLTRPWIIKTWAWWKILHWTSRNKCARRDLKFSRLWSLNCDILCCDTV